MNRENLDRMIGEEAKAIKDELTSYWLDEVRDLAEEKFKSGAQFVANLLLGEIEKLKKTEVLCPACGTDWNLEDLSRCRTVICDELTTLKQENKILREALEGYSKCDGFCGEDECVCNVKPAITALAKFKEGMGV